MKIAVLTHSSRKAGGLFYSVRALSKEIARKGHEVRIFSAKDEFSDEDAGVWTPLEIEYYPTALGVFQYGPTLLKQLGDFRPDIIHLHGIWLGNQYAAYRYQKKTGCPVVVSPRGMLDPWALKNSAWKKKIILALFASSALKNATVMHALCESEYESMRQFGLKNPIAVSPNGFAIPEKNPEKIMGDGPRQMLFMSRLHPKKGLLNLLPAWAAIRPAGWQLVIAGWDQGRHDLVLKKKCDELKLSWKDNPEENRLTFDPVDVVFVGSKYGENKDLLLRRADCFILPSYSEGLPMAVLEAWVYSLPTVITPQCNLPEAFEAAASVRIEPDAASIEQALRMFFALPASEVRKLSDNGRRLVEEKFSWAHIGQQIEDVYAWCMDHGKTADCIRF